MSARKPRINKVCATCGKTFQVIVTSVNKVKFCSHRCLTISKTGPQVTKSCTSCGRDFTVPQRLASQQYCSMACRCNKVEKECLRCGKPFSVVASIADRRQHCSRACQRSPVSIYTCLNCSAEFERSESDIATGRFTGVYCSLACRIQHKQLAIDNYPVFNCKTCGKEFSRRPYDAERGGAVYCSADCMKTRQTLICLHCKKPFEALQSRVKKGQAYCSRDCLWAATGKQPVPVVPCSYCGKHFKCDSKRLNNKHVYCSNECFYKHKGHTPAVLVECGHCGKLFYRNRCFLHVYNYCSKECLTKGHRGDRRACWCGGKDRESYPPQFDETLKEEIRSYYEGLCQLCGSSQSGKSRKHSVHHIDYDKDNLQFTNLIILCNKCHGRTNHCRTRWTKFFQERVKQEITSSNYP